MHSQMFLYLLAFLKLLPNPVKGSLHHISLRHHRRATADIVIETYTILRFFFSNSAIIFWRKYNYTMTATRILDYG